MFVQVITDIYIISVSDDVCSHMAWYNGDKLDPDLWTQKLK